MKQEHINEIKAIIIFAFGMILLASLVSYTPLDLSLFTSQPNVPAKNLIGVIGANLAGGLLFVFGISAYAFVGFLFFWSINKFLSREIDFNWSKGVGALVFVCVFSALISMLGSDSQTEQFERAGLIGSSLSGFLIHYIQPMGALITLTVIGILSLIVTSEILIIPLILGSVAAFRKLFNTETKGKKKEAFSLSKLKPNINFGHTAKKSKVEEEQEDEEEDEEEWDEDEEEYEDEEEDDEEYEDEDEEEYEDEEDEDVKPSIKIQKDSKKSKAPKKPEIVGEYRLPPFSLLDDSPEIATSKIESTLVSGAKLLEDTLANFGVNAKVVDIERGPAITRYELQPAPGVKVQKFTVLQDDIALAMRSSSVRIVAPIPGKSRVGIEVPNDSSASVYLKDVLSSEEFQSQKSKSKLTLSLGKDIAGRALVADLAQMPHLLIAGTTGSGKTVCVNSIIMSILMNASPSEVRFVMVDPKMVELAQYNDIPHLMCPTVTDPKKASAVLNWVVGEMENRYKTLAAAGARNIVGYNEKGNSMHYIVVIIDELADLMQVSAKTVESSITRLAQLSRAVGIHLILATQRPSVNVITGVIKANFPARISFKVASKIDSRTVLDMNGSETLLGKGDMLFIQPGDPKPTRGQGNFVKDEEINRVIQHIKDQQSPSYDETILRQQKVAATGGTGEKDEYYEEAVKLVIETNQASVSILQRRMRLGYTRAARLIDMMEQEGIVGPYVGSKPRDILIDREQWLVENMGEEAQEEEES